MSRNAVLLAGNEAMVEAAIAAGCDCYFGYPITPQNEACAAMSKRMPEEGRVFLQSESELAAISMVYGAAAAGARVMTSSSSPGISLMQEGISYLVGAELPAVIVNVMRGGPGLGNIDPSQADYFQSVKGGGHGDYHMIVLAPSSVQEMVDLVMLAFDLADEYRNPVMILGDGMLGQMMEPVVLPDPVPRALPDRPSPGVARGAVQEWALTGAVGRPARWIRSLYLERGALEEHNKRLQAKFARMAKEVRWEGEHVEGAELLVVAYGTCARICSGAVRQARKEGRPVGLFRPVTLWPFPEEALREAVGERGVLVVEMSAGQMVEDVRLALGGEAPVRFFGRTGGGVPTPDEVYERIVEALQ